MNLFAGQKWSSSHHALSIAYNPNVWRLIPQTYDEESSALFGLIDVNDGSSFGFDLIRPSPEEYYEYEFGEAEYFARLFNVDNDAAETNRFALTVSDRVFRCVSYLFNNPKFGRQHLVRGMYISEENVIGISMAWSHGPDLQSEVSIPPKFQFFLDNLVLE